MNNIEQKGGNEMRRGINPAAVVVMIIMAVAAVVVAVLGRNALPVKMEPFKGLIFWAIIIGIGGGGAVFAGKKINKRR